MPIKAMLVEKVSKNGNKYTCIELYLTSDVKKMVFLDNAELELIKITRENNNK